LIRSACPHHVAKLRLRGMGGYRKCVAVAAAIIAAAVGSCYAPPSVAAEPAQSCSKENFESVVEEAAGSLRDLNSKNRPLFQEKLRQLKEKRHWNHDEFIDKAKPFVKDEKTAVYDQATDELLSAIASMGQLGASSSSPDCALMIELRVRMKNLVDTQLAKWVYMFQKLDAELAN
jgi:hypothetical protein